MTRCTCTVFARSGKLHNHDCPKYQAYVAKQQTLIPSKQRKASKRGRIKAMVKKLRTDEPPIDWELMELLGVKEDTK